MGIKTDDGTSIRVWPSDLRSCPRRPKTLEISIYLPCAGRSYSNGRGPPRREADPGAIRIKAWWRRVNRLAPDLANQAVIKLWIT